MSSKKTAFIEEYPEEYDKILDAAEDIWRKHIEALDVDASKHQSKYNKYLNGIWTAAADLPTIPRSIKKRK